MKPSNGSSVGGSCLDISRISSLAGIDFVLSGGQVPLAFVFNLLAH